MHFPAPTATCCVRPVENGNIFDSHNFASSLVSPRVLKLKAPAPHFPTNRESRESFQFPLAIAYFKTAPHLKKKSRG